MDTKQEAETVEDKLGAPELLQRNITATIENPLSRLSREQLLVRARSFATSSGLDVHASTFEKAALVAQNPDFESLTELDENDKLVLRYEQEHKWGQPKALYMTIIMCSVGAAVQGWDQTGGNGANLSFPIEFGINPEEGAPHYQRNEWLLGLVNGSPHIGASFCGCWLSDPLNHYFGRRGTIFFSAVFCCIPVLCQGFVQNWPQLLVCRLLLGIGWGCKASIVPVFAAENSPAYIRGGLVMCWQMWTAFGILLGFSANLVFYRVGKIAWRLQLASAFLPALVLGIGIYFCPESPRYLMKKRRPQAAFTSLCRLRKTHLQAARDLFFMDALLEAEATLFSQSTNYFQRFCQLFTIPRNRRATLASFIVMMTQQMCGINVISYYSSSVFVTAGASVAGALLISFAFGAVNFIFAIPALRWIDSYGRRSLLLATFPLMIITLLAAGMCFFIPEDKKSHLGLVATFIILFSILYSPGAGPVPFTYSAECFPLSHREVGMSFAVASINFWGFILSLTYFRIVGAFTIEGAFGFYAGLNVLCFTLVFLFLRETKQKTLEELDYVFGVPTGVSVRHKVFAVLPAFLRRCVLLDKSATIPDLYHEEKKAPVV